MIIWLHKKKKKDFLGIIKTFHFNIEHNTFTMKLHFPQLFSAAQEDTVLCLPLDKAGAHWDLVGRVQDPAPSTVESSSHPALQ